MTFGLMARWLNIYGLERQIKACGTSSREYRDILLGYSTYKRYIEAQYGSVDKFMRKFGK